MSRANFENDRYQFSFGVDHACGTFFQVWDKQLLLEEDVPSIDVDSQFGIRIVHPNVLIENRRLQREMLDLQAAWGLSQRNGIRHPNMTGKNIIDIGKALGFPEDLFAKKVYELWD